MYYHRANTEGIGFDRTKSGSNALAQYFPPVQEKFGNLATCPEEFLLWFHRVGWDHKLKSGRTLWNELCYKYYGGADGVKQMQQTWNAQAPLVDPERFQHVKTFLGIQAKEAQWWRDACVLYFQTFSKRPIPAELPKPTQTLDYFMKLDPKMVPGI